VILHPGTLALLLGSGIVFVMVVYGSVLGTRVLSRWDFQSSSEEQLILERKTFLVSSIVRYALGFEAISALLFVFTVDDIHELFVGAMCATGSLNANPIGWSALYVKIAVLVVAPVWIALDHLDQRAGDYPLIRAKYVLLLLLTPLVGLDLYLQIRYFAGLRPEIITSCCGALFSESGSAVASELAGLPVVPMMWVFYLTVFFFIATNVFCMLHESGVVRYVLLALSIVLFVVSITAVISFISPYVYRLPTHHCPFDMFQVHYRFVAYPIYLGLFGSVLFGLLPGIFHPLKRVSSLAELIASAERKWLASSMITAGVFVAVVSWPVVFGAFTMTGY